MSAELSARRKAFFWLMLAALACIPLLVLEALLRVVGPTVLDDPYLNLGRVPTFFQEKEIQGQRRYQLTHSETYSLRNITFPAEKGPDTLRVFCLGGSASAGWPHPAREIYSFYLAQSLQRAFPGREIEVINASGHAYASYRVRMIFEEVIDYEPDLIVLYSGNNEFLEHRSYLDTQGPGMPVLSAANKLATFRLARGVVGRWLLPDNALTGSKRDHVTYAIWSKLEQIALRLRSDPEQLARLQSHYAFSLEAMVELAQRRRVPVVLATIPVNLRDWLPNVSHQSLSEPEALPWRELVRSGRAALLRGEPERSVQSLEQAIGLDPEHAESHLHLARAYERLGRHEEAVASYGRARDLDRNPFRALPAMNTALRSLADRYDNAHLADVELAFRQASAPFAPGFDLFLDYVHPNQRGNWIVAETVYGAIARHELLGPAPAARRFTRLPSQPDAKGKVYSEQADFSMQMMLLRLSIMMHQYENAVAKARYLSETPGASESLAPPNLTLMRAALDVFPELVEMDRKQILGMPVEAAASRSLDERLQHFYRTQFEGYERFKSEYGAEEES